MTSLLVAVLVASGVTAPPPERAAFVTTLGRDTVVIESIMRTPSHLDGEIVVRIPGTVLCHYTADLDKDGTVTKTVVEIKPMGTTEVKAQKMTLIFNKQGAVQITAESDGGTPQTGFLMFKDGYPFFMTGFGSSYGLYSSLGMYELYLPHLPAGNDTVTLKAIDMYTGKPGTRLFLRRSPTQVAVDYFNIAWTELTVDADGRISAADANGTTEKTETRRVEFVDVGNLAKTYAALDKAGHGIGAASVNKIQRGSIGGQSVVVAFGSPQKRGREILGNVVKYGRVWRTGANEATTINLAHDVTIGGQAVPAGTYSLWTVPAQDGTVNLIINKQFGQWGTDYDASQDLTKVPMHVATAPSPQENFAINVTGSGNTGELSISWDTFIWTVPIALK